MPLADDLLVQAKLLASFEANRPKQSSLRRAVSAAYYALFHLLIDAAVKNLVRGGPAGLEHLMRRGFAHKEMKEACKSLTTPTPLGPANHLLTKPLSDDLIKVAKALDSLQALRHVADYDLGRPFSRTDVLVHVGEVENAFKAWHRAKGSANSKVFLVSLLMHGRWNK